MSLSSILALGPGTLTTAATQGTPATAESRTRSSSDPSSGLDYQRKQRITRNPDGTYVDERGRY